MALSKKYLVLMLWQADFSFGGLAIPLHKNLLEGMNRKWNPHRKTKFYVIDRNQGGVKSVYESEDSFFCFHTANAFDKGDNLYINLCRYHNHSVLFDLFIDRLRSDSPIVAKEGKSPLTAPEFVQFKLEGISLKKRGVAKVEKSYGSRNNIELPVWNTSYDRKQQRYVYGIHSKNESSFVKYIIKIDIDTGETKTFGIDKCTPGEPIFIPRPGATDEDDGVLLVVCLDGAEGKSLVAVVDAQTMELVARADMPDGKVVSSLWLSWCLHRQHISRSSC
jgi:torulene dioxygenase